jgi:hypothetical protein
MSSKKKRYESPQLAVYGSVEEITQMPTPPGKLCSGGDSFGSVGAGVCKDDGTS